MLPPCFLKAFIGIGAYFGGPGYTHSVEGINQATLRQYRNLTNGKLYKTHVKPELKYVRTYQTTSEHVKG